MGMQNPAAKKQAAAPTQTAATAAPAASAPQQAQKNDEQTQQKDDDDGGDGKQLSTGAVAKLLGVSDETIRRWCKSGKIPYKLVGPFRVIRIKPGDAEKMQASK